MHRFLVYSTALIMVACEYHVGSPQAPDHFGALVEVARLIPSSGQGYDFYQVTHMGTLSDGRIVALNAGHREILIFSSSGRMEARFGAAGLVPGEFSRPTFLTTLPGDSILVTHPDPSRGVVFTSDGSVARTFTIELPKTGTRFVGPIGVTANQILVTIQGQEPWAPGVTTGMRYIPATVHVYDLEGSPLHQFRQEGVGDEFYLYEHNGRIRFSRLPFGGEGLIAAGASGVALAGTSSRDVVTLDPDLLRGDTIQISGAVHVLRRSLVDSARNMWAEAATTDELRVSRQRALPNIPPLLTVPVIGDLQIDRLGRLWVAAEPVNASETLLGIN